MKVIYAKLKNVLGFDLFEMNPGQITVLSGKNGLGKSSVIDALRNVIEGGALKTIRNVNAPDDEPSEIALVFDSNDGRVLVNKTEKGLTIKTQIGDSAAYKIEAAPKTFLDQLSDAKARNPMLLITARDKEIVDRILEAIELPYNRDALWESTGLAREEFVSVPVGMHPLQEIAVVRDLVFRERTGVNRDEKQKRGSCEQARRAIPESIPTVEGVDELDREIQSLRSQRQAVIADAELTREVKLSELKAKEAKVHSDARSGFEKFEAALKIEMADRLAEKRASITAWVSGAIEKIAKLESESLQKLKTDMDSVSPLADVISANEIALATLREQEKDVIRIRTIKNQADTFEAEAEYLKGRSVQLTEALAAIDSYKADMCRNLPIPGMDITDGAVTVHGVPWSQLNTAQRIKLAVKISCLKMADSKYRPVWVDGAEALDSESFADLVEELKVAGAQAFIGRVKDHALKAEVI